MIPPEDDATDAYCWCWCCGGGDHFIPAEGDATDESREDDEDGPLFLLTMTMM